MVSHSSICDGLNNLTNTITTTLFHLANDTITFRSLNNSFFPFLEGFFWRDDANNNNTDASSLYTNPQPRKTLKRARREGRTLHITFFILYFLVYTILFTIHNNLFAKRPFSFYGEKRRKDGVLAAVLSTLAKKKTAVFDGKIDTKDSFFKTFIYFISPRGKK